MGQNINIDVYAFCYREIIAVGIIFSRTKMADKVTLTGSTDQVAKPEGSNIMRSDSKGQQQQVTRKSTVNTQDLITRGKPFEDLGNRGDVNRHVVYISQNAETDYRNQCKALSFRGVPLEENLVIPQISRRG